MDALEVGVFRGIPGLDQRLEARGHQGGDTAAEDALFAEQVGLGLDLEGGLEDTRSCAADAGRVGQAVIQRMAGVVLINRDQVGDAVAFEVFRTDGVAGALRGDHDDVDVCGRDDLLEVDVKAVGERQGLPFGQVGGDVLLVHIRLLLVGDQDHDDVGCLGRFRHGHDGQTGLSGLLRGLGAFVKADDDVDARVAQVQRMGVALGAEADNGNLFAVEGVDVTVFLIIDFHCHGNVPPQDVG